MLNFINYLMSIISFKSNKYNKFTIEKRGNQDIVFEGVLIASVWGFWGNMYLYKTKNKNYVCHFNSSTKDKICVIETRGKTPEKIYDEIISFFGYSKTAKRLYKKAGIHHSDIFID